MYPMYPASVMQAIEMQGNGRKFEVGLEVAWFLQLSSCFSLVEKYFLETIWATWGDSKELFYTALRNCHCNVYAHS